jgi:hypothetical protein
MFETPPAAAIAHWSALYLKTIQHHTTHWDMIDRKKFSAIFGEAIDFFVKPTTDRTMVHVKKSSLIGTGQRISNKKTIIETIYNTPAIPHKLKVGYIYMQWQHICIRVTLEHFRTVNTTD